MRHLLQLVKNIFKLTFFTLIIFELFSFILVKLNCLPFVNTPALYQANSGDFVSIDKWRNERSEWGGWHNSSLRTVHEGKCFKTEYKSNSIGARDDEFFFDQKQKKIILIGDSFAEGFGVETSKRAGDLIEKSTGYQVYNFGSTPDVGPVQYNIIYKKLASKYEHDILLIFFLPINDFNDNDYAYWSLLKRNIVVEGKERYRPYWIKNDDNTYGYFIPKDAVKTNDQYSEILGYRAFFKRNFWVYNLFQSLEFYLKLYKLQRVSGVSVGAILDSSNGYSGYFDASYDQQRAAVWFLDDLMSWSKAKKIILVSIPARSDYKRIESGSNVESMFWYKSFQTAGSRLGRDISFIDLSKEKLNNWNDNFLSCDPHWGEEGNSMAAKIISDYLR